MDKKRKRNSPSDSPEARRARRAKHYKETQCDREGRAYCTICGGTLRRGGLSEAIGYHRKCDPAKYQADLRARLRGGEQ